MAKSPVDEEELSQQQQQAASDLPQSTNKSSSSSSVRWRQQDSVVRSGTRQRGGTTSQMSSRPISTRHHQQQQQPGVGGAGGHDELKEWLTRRWESSGNGADSDTPPSAATVSTSVASVGAGVKRKASDVLETPADSTDDVLAYSRGGAGARKTGAGGGGKVSRSNILLASLLATRASTEQPVVNTLSLGSAMATVTPQTTLLQQRRASTDSAGSTGGLVASLGARKPSASSVTSLPPGGLQQCAPPQRSYSGGGQAAAAATLSGSRRAGTNPMLTDASVPSTLYQDGAMPGVDVVPSPTPRDEFDSVIDSLYAGDATAASAGTLGGPLGGTLGGPGTGLLDDRTLLSQLEAQLFSSLSAGTIRDARDAVLTCTQKPT